MNIIESMKRELAAFGRSFLREIKKPRSFILLVFVVAPTLIMLGEMVVFGTWYVWYWYFFGVYSVAKYFGAPLSQELLRFYGSIWPSFWFGVWLFWYLGRIIWESIKGSRHIKNNWTNFKQIPRGKRLFIISLVGLAIPTFLLLYFHTFLGVLRDETQAVSWAYTIACLPFAAILAISGFFIIIDRDLNKPSQ